MQKVVTKYSRTYILLNPSYFVRRVQINEENLAYARASIINKNYIFYIKSIRISMLTAFIKAFLREIPLINVILTINRSSTLLIIK